MYISSGNSNPPEVLKVLRQLPKPEENWIDFAHFMGYSDDDPEISSIIRSKVPPAVRLQIFLRICRIPDCGDMTYRIIECLKNNHPLFGGQLRRQQSGKLEYIDLNKAYLTIFSLDDLPQGQPMQPVLSKPSPPSKPVSCLL